MPEHQVTTEYDNHHDSKHPDPSRDPEVGGRVSPARGALVPEGSGLVIAALFLALLGVVLIGFGQLPAIVLFPIALALGFWGRHRLKRNTGTSA
jgi:hypothetical protein